MADRVSTVTGRHAVAPAPGRPSREPLLRHVIGGILRAERTGQGRTLLEVSQAARMSMPYLSEVERGRKEASSEILAAVAGALGLRLVDMVARAQTELSRPDAVRTLGAVTEPVSRSTAAGSATLLAA